MPKTSAGIVLFRRRPPGVEVLLVHPGGPFWTKKDEGTWSIPKGEVGPGEDLLAAAKREFREETGAVAEGAFLDLGTVKQPSGKLVAAWASEGVFDPASLTSEHFTMEWPPRSGKSAAFPEVDKAEWFDLETAKRKILKGQRPILDALAERLKGERPLET
ncbi:NUDIX domain-containing protein [Roseiarcus sp.]|uniref:NUDIX domain-containing protein n=1 Tax=Roseiarcus sp. TaxID=1969460 RepID=UPI003F997F1D